ncbi:hypothetical protein G7Z17_g9695 [Cylindrodendrum hubeiense]|uniref:Uncharacterized protein n=1 Tax=Cylindrodendrum hubeiense TaxID=595255 RepID=A0A9P5H8N3_9HYPO|nr:hypothetical protein G7Z17_g9695 [Cylindrodendrum hubeiense]
MHQLRYELKEAMPTPKRAPDDDPSATHPRKMGFRTALTWSHGPRVQPGTHTGRTPGLCGAAQPTTAVRSGGQASGKERNWNISMTPKKQRSFSPIAGLKTPASIFFEVAPPWPILTDMSLCNIARSLRAQPANGWARATYGLRRYSSAVGTGLPLEGIRVLDMTRVLAGPYCTQILGDLGAEVIKIEHPVRGDDTRAWGPPYAQPKAGSSSEGPGESAYFLGANRNKKSVGLSFQHKDGVDILHKLAAKCDVLVENYLPGALKKYDMDYETLHKINPGLIYASITGYGQTGPYSNRAGYDVMVEAEFGLMHITGERDGPPVKVGVAVTDLTTGLYTSNSVMAALLSRAKTGRGQHIDVALSDCQMATLANIASSSSIVPYKAFATKDGDILFGGGNDRLFGVMSDGLGQPQWKDDPRYKTNADRVAHRQELEGKIEDITRQKTTQEWLDVFEGKGMPYAAINDVQGALNHEHTKARNMVVEVEHETCGTIKMVNTPIKMSETQPTIRSAPPTLGEHTDEVLLEHLGLSKSEVSKLKASGAIA